MNTAIVSNGRARFWQANSEKFTRRRAQLWLEAEARYAGELRLAGFWKRWHLRRKIRKEVMATLRSEFPSDQALFWRR